MQHHPSIQRDSIARFAALLRRWLRFVFWLLLRRNAEPDSAALDLMEYRTRRMILARAMARIEIPKIPRHTRRPHSTPAGFRARRGGRSAHARMERLALPSLRDLKPRERVRVLEHAHANLDAYADRLIARIKHAFLRAPFIIASPCAVVLNALTPSFAPAYADTS